MSTSLTITVLGLGRAGSQLSADLVAAGALVIAYDPADVEPPEGVAKAASPAEAVEGADLVIAATAPSQAPAALAQVVDHLGRDAVYADVSTGSPKLKRGLAITAGTHDVSFVGVAILSLVSGVGLDAPMLASGPGVERFAELLGEVGANVEVMGDDAGAAASRKMLRAIMIRGVAALAAEALAAGIQAGDAEWLWENLSQEFADADESWLDQVFDAFGPYADMRRGEVEVIPHYLADLSVAPTMTNALVELTRSISAAGLPRRPS